MEKIPRTPTGVSPKRVILAPFLERLVAGCPAKRVLVGRATRFLIRAYRLL